MNSLLKKRKIVEKLVRKLLNGGTSEEEDSEIFNEISNLSLDEEWSNYLFWSEEYFDENEIFLMDKFLDKIFSYEENIIICPIKNE